MRIKSFLTNLGPENIDDLFKIKKANFYAKNPAYVNDLTKIENDYVMLKSIARKASFVKRNEIKINGIKQRKRTDFSINILKVKLTFLIMMKMNLQKFL